MHYGENVHGYNGHVQEKDFKFIGKNVNSWKHCSQGPKLNTQFWDRSLFNCAEILIYQEIIIRSYFE